MSRSKILRRLISQKKAAKAQVPAKKKAPAKPRARVTKKKTTEAK